MTRSLGETDIAFVPVARDNWSDFEEFFQSVGILCYCWCMAWRMTNEERKQGDSSAYRKELMKQRVWAGIPVGLLARAGDEVIGWCSVAPRETYRRLGGDDSLDHVWSVTCFYIKPAYRGKGLISQMIGQAKEYAKQSGARYLEAYPVKPDSPSYRFMGFVGSFERAGFVFNKTAGTRRHVMTYQLIDL